MARPRVSWVWVVKQFIALALVLMIYAVGTRLGAEATGLRILILAVEGVCAYALGFAPAVLAAVGGFIILTFFVDLERTPVVILTGDVPFLLVSGILLLFANHRRKLLIALKQANADLRIEVAGQSVTIADQGTAIARHLEALRLRGLDLQKLSRELVEIEARERARLRKLLHDNAQQILVAGKIQAAMIEKKCGLEPGTITQYLQGSIEALRDVTRDLGVGYVAEEIDFEASLRNMARDFCDRFPIEIQVNLRTAGLGEYKLALAHRMPMVELAREALLNVVKHAPGSPARLDLDSGTTGVSLRIIDEGPGLAPGWRKAGTGAGIAAAGRRIEALGGTWSIGPNPDGKGVVVAARLPPMVLRSAGRADQDLFNL